MTAITRTPVHRDRSVSRATSVDDDLRDLEIDGYRIEFSTRVALLPVALEEAEQPPAPPLQEPAG